jgi:hypothetical protein
MNLRCGHLGAEVVGIDIARSLVHAGIRRAAVAGLIPLSDASNPEGVSDQSFDVTVSMFAPKPLDLAKDKGARPRGFYFPALHRNARANASEAT